MGEYKIRDLNSDDEWSTEEEEEDKESNLSWETYEGDETFMDLADEFKKNLKIELETSEM